MVYAHQVRLNLEIGRGVELKEAFRISPDSSSLELQPTLLIGSLPRNGKLEFICEFLVSPFSEKKDKIYLLAGRLFLDIPNRAEPVSMRLDLDRNISLQVDPLAPPQIIVQAMSTLTLYRIQERARKAVEEGKISEATRMLQNLATHLFSQGQSDLAATVLHEASHVQRTSTFSDVGDKRIKYGTRALLLPSNMEREI